MLLVFIVYYWQCCCQQCFEECDYLYYVDLYQEDWQYCYCVIDYGVGWELQDVGGEELFGDFQFDIGQQVVGSCIVLVYCLIGYGVVEQGIGQCGEYQ